MPATCCPPVDESGVADEAGFDLSDADEVDIGCAELPTTEPRRTTSRDRADLAADVLAMCALLVFKDRRRQRNRPRTLPGIALPGSAPIAAPRCAGSGPIAQALPTSRDELQELDKIV